LISQWYGDLGAGNLPVAVRSSATVEDLPGMSFAGQQETYLNVRSSDNVLEAVKRYRARQGIRP
jgi:phosphoenolpyruvate synthase/pyruvate phosphate dikinase